MSTDTRPSARDAGVPPVEIPPTPSKRFNELTAILARGLLRLHARPEPAPDSAGSGRQAVPEESSEPGRWPLVSPRG